MASSSNPLSASASDTSVDIQPFIEKIREVQDEIDRVPTYLPAFKESFLSRAESGEFSRLGSSQSNLAKHPTFPVLVKEETQLQKEYLKKLKSKYIEYQAKAKFLKFIRKDEGEQSIAQNDLIEAQNKIDKAELQEHKRNLQESHDRARLLAKRLEDERALLIQEAKDASRLAMEVSEMRLELMRIKRDKPASERLTVAEAEKQLDTQVLQLQELDEQLHTIQSQTESNKAAGVEVTNELEQLRPEVVKAKAQLEAMAAVQGNAKAAEESQMLSGLRDWYAAGEAVYKKTFGLESMTTPSENELRLTYKLPLPYTVSLVFNHVTRKLADVQITGLHKELPVDFQEYIALGIAANDVPRLLHHVRAVLWHVCQGLAPEGSVD